MACVTFKRSFELESMYNKPCKRPRYNTSTQNVSPPSLSTLNLNSDPKSPQQQQDHTSPFAETTSRMTPEKMAANIKEEAHRLSRKRDLQSSLQVNEDRRIVKSPRRSDFSEDDKALFTFSQVGLICERMLREQRQKIREEYETVLNAKLAEQYDTFIKFTHDQIYRKLKSEAQPSYLS